MSKYKDQVNAELTEKVKTIKKELPEPMKKFISFKEATILSPNTLLSYATELREFCRYLADNNSYFANKPMSEITFEDFDAMTADDATEFQSSLSGKKLATIKHYRTTLTQFFNYLVALSYIKRNPFSILTISNSEKNKNKQIHYLDDNERQAFLDALWKGTGIGKAYYERNRMRDIAICELFLATGLRISELIGLDITDLYFNNHCIDVMRKGSRESTSYVYLTDEMEDILKEYIKDFRPKYAPAPKNNALFLAYGKQETKEIKVTNPKTGEEETIYIKKTAPGERIGVKAVERIVKRYIKASVPHKYDVITTHKLRTTFASMMLRKTGGQVELVKNLMNHSTILSTEAYIDSTTDEMKNAIRGDG